MTKGEEIVKKMMEYAKIAHENHYDGEWCPYLVDVRKLIFDIDRAIEEAIKTQKDNIKTQKDNIKTQKDNTYEKAEAYFEQHGIW